MNSIVMPLIDSTIQNHLYNSLQQCHKKRESFYHTIFIAIIVVLFFGIFGTVLYIFYKSKPTKQEIYNQSIKDQEYILSLIRYYNGQLQNTTSSLSNLPYQTQ